MKPRRAFGPCGIVAIGAWWLVLLVGLIPVPGEAQLTRIERARGLIMLDVVREDIEKHYFDPAYGGVDLKAVFDTARSKVQRAERIEQVFGAIAVAALELNDSHTAFIPPGLVYRAEYGWNVRFVGDTCRIIEVREGSDAAQKGVRVGDALLEVNGVRLTRRNLWQLKYSIHALQPRSSLRMNVLSPNLNTGARELEIRSKVIERRRILDPSSSFDLWQLIREGENEWEEWVPRHAVIDQRVLVWRLQEFHSDGSWIDDLHKLLRSRDALVLDLRGNGGGAVSALTRLVGRFYEQDVVVATELRRKERTEMVAKGAGKNRFHGSLVVLVDAESGSASEVFARTVQLTDRGKVVGDRTAGAVRASRTYIHAVGTQTAAFYGASVTVSDLMMPDGGRLENTGVTPDEVVLPSGDDLAAGHDPALARALSLVGVSRTPKEAGALVFRK